MAAVSFGHLLALLLLGWLLVVLEVYWILDDAGRPASLSALMRADAQTQTAKTQTRHGHLKGKASLGIDIQNTARFPSYGSKEFTNLCPYTAFDALPPPIRPNCTIINHPSPGSNEGLAAWFSSIVQLHLITRQNGCALKFDYGPGLDLSTVVIPQPVSSTPSAAGSDPSNTNTWWQNYIMDWSTDNVDCEANAFCSEHTKENFKVSRLSYQYRKLKNGMMVSETPNYRYYLVGVNSRFNATLYDPLKETLSGFDVRLGAACSLGMLLRPSPDIVKYEPTFFSHLLPTLRNADTLVLALYIRSGFADTSAAAEKRGQNATDGFGSQGAKRVDESADCAKALEVDLLAQDEANRYKKVVWLVVSDSQFVKEYVADTYGDQRLDSNVGPVTRSIVHANARGMHTRRKRDVSVQDFASAFIDFYLLGESSAVIGTSGIFSFGAVAALRTARPLYSTIPTATRSKEEECQGTACFCRKR